MAVPPLAARAAVADMGVTDESLRGRWFSWYVCAFLLGAALGGLGFGWLGDRFGRAKALGWSVLTYSLLAGACYFVNTPQQMLVVWFLACTGVGGVWQAAPWRAICERAGWAERQHKLPAACSPAVARGGTRACRRAGHATDTHAHSRPRPKQPRAAGAGWGGDTRTQSSCTR